MSINVKKRLDALNDKIMMDMRAGLASDKVIGLIGGNFYTEHGREHDLRVCALGCLMHARGLKTNLFSFESAHALWALDFPGMEHWAVSYTYPNHLHDGEMVFLFPQLSHVISTTSDRVAQTMPDDKVLDEIDQSLRQWIEETHEAVCP